MKHLSIISLLLSLVAIGLVYKQEPQSQKIAFIKTGVLLEQVEMAANAKKKLSDEQQEVEANLKELESKLAEKHEAFIKEQAALSTEERKARMKELYEEEGKLERYKQAAIKKLQAREAELMEPVFQVINARIKTFAERNDYVMLWGTISDGNILHGDKAYDVTDDVVKYINSQK